MISRQLSWIQPNICFGDNAKLFNLADTLTVLAEMSRGWCDNPIHP